MLWNLHIQCGGCHSEYRKHAAPWRTDFIPSSAHYGLTTSTSHPCKLWRSSFDIQEKAPSVGCYGLFLQQSLFTVKGLIWHPTKDPLRNLCYQFVIQHVYTNLSVPVICSNKNTNVNAELSKVIQLEEGIYVISSSSMTNKFHSPDQLLTALSWYGWKNVQFAPDTCKRSDIWQSQHRSLARRCKLEASTMLDKSWERICSILHKDVQGQDRHIWKLQPAHEPKQAAMSFLMQNQAF